MSARFHPDFVRLKYMDPLINTTLKQYRIVEMVRRGGMATVYKAYQEALDRYVAVKVLRSNNDPQFAARFKREARALAQLQHPNILPVYDYGEQDGLLFLALQYIEDGSSLNDLLGEPMEPARALRLTSRVLAALEYAHSRGIIHRDIKPANILMSAPGWPMLADFGIVKLRDDNQKLTMPGLVIGTAAYMAPEQGSGLAIDARTDLYSMGVVLYELVTGRVPFDAPTPMAVLAKHAYEPPPPPHSIVPNLPRDVEAILLRALEKDPAARFPTAAAMAAECDAVAARIERHSNSTLVITLYQSALSAFEQGQLDEAARQLQQAQALDPDNQEVSALLKTVQETQQRNRDEGRRLLDQVRRQPPSEPQSAPRPAPEQPASRAPGDAVGPAPQPAANNPRTRQLEPEQALPAPTPAAPPAPKPEQRAARPATPPAKAEPPAPRPAPQPAAPTPAPPAARVAGSPSSAAERSRLPLIVGALALLLLLAVGVRVFLRSSSGPGPEPTGAATSAATSVAVAATTTAPATPATEPLPQPAGQVIFEDDFGAGAEKSDLVPSQPSPDLAASIEPPGVYTIKLSKPDQMRTVLLPRLAAGNFALQIDLADGSADVGGTAAQGVVFRARDTSHFYALLIDPRHRQYAVGKRDGDTWTYLIAAKASDLIQGRDAPNQVRVDASGDTFTIYLNGAKLDSFRDGAYTFGMVGAIVANGDATTSTMRFDNLKVWSNDPPPTAPNLPVTRQDIQGDMMLIPGGEFVMGSNDSPDALPHMVTLPDFYIDRTEVTNFAYVACADSLGCDLPKLQDSATHKGYSTAPDFLYFPVINVTWQQARDFCEKVDKRLPSEAEWERAASWDARTRTKTVWPWLGAFDPARLNSAESKHGDTVGVGTFQGELNGTSDMAGNVAEWTASLSQPYPYDPSGAREAAQAPGQRVVRGGSWAQPQDEQMTYTRQPADPTTASNTIGFRCADR